MSETLPPRIITEPVTLTVNGQEIVAQKGELLIDACQRGGTYIPRFCYHPRMEPVGMCRMCIVEVDTGRGPALQPSCMLECTDGMAVNTESDKVVKAQDGVLEFLLINHPLDCPVCDKGGECPLQDQTMAYGPGESRWVEEKRHYVKPIPVSETVYLDRERCILCDRCTRFASDVAGDALIHFMGRGANTEVNTFPDEPFASYFSGNTVQICPVGALTAKPFRFKARPWDLEEVESTCTTCAVGCRVAVQSSRDEVLRYQGVDSDPVNWGWLCDKGRFGFEAVNSDDRLTAPLIRSGSELTPTTWSTALDGVASSIRAAVTASGPGSVAVLGGANLTNEAAYAWAKLAKSVIRTDHVDAQLGDGLPAELLAALAPATINDVCRPGGTVIYLGPDPKEVLPVLHLRLRHAAVKDGVKIIEISPTRTALSQLATATVTYRPGEVVSAIRSLFGGAAGGGAGGTDGTSAEDQSLVRARAALAAADGAVTVVVGRPTVTEPAGYIVDAVAELTERLEGVTFLPVLRRANVRGALDAGLAPGMLPGRVRRQDGADWFAAAWGAVPDADGLDAAGILRAAADGKIETLVLLGADPLSDFPDHNLAERALAGARTVVAVDQFLNPSSSRAHIVLAAAGFAEVAGTTTNIEGRVTVVNQKVTPPGTARSDLELAAELAHRLGADLGLSDPVAVRAELAQISPLHAGWTEDVLSAGRSIDGIVLPIAVVVDEPVIDEPAAGEVEDDPSDDDTSDEDALAVEPEPTGPVLPAVCSTLPAGIGSLPANDAYSLRLVAVPALYDQGTVVQHMRSSSGLATDAVASLHSTEAAKLGLANGDLVRVIGNDSSLVVPARIDDGVPRGSVAVGWQRANAALTRLIDSSAAVCDVRIEVSS